MQPLWAILKVFYTLREGKRWAKIIKKRTCGGCFKKVYLRSFKIHAEFSFHLNSDLSVAYFREQSDYDSELDGEWELDRGASGRNREFQGGM